MKTRVHTTSVAISLILLIAVGCSKNGDADGFEGRVYHACNLDIPIEKGSGALFAFGQEANTLYILNLSKSLKLDIPEWCISPTQEVITEHCPDIRAVLTVYLDEEATQQNRLSFPVGKAEQFLKMLSSDKVLVVKQAKRSFAIRPGHVYNILGAIRNRTVHESDGKEYHIVYVDVSRLQYVRGASSTPEVQEEPRSGPTTGAQEIKFDPDALSSLSGKKVKWSGTVKTTADNGRTVTLLLGSQQDDAGNETIYVAQFSLPANSPPDVSEGDTVVFEGILQEEFLVKEEGVFKNYFDKVTQTCITLLLQEPRIISATKGDVGKE